MDNVKQELHTTIGMFQRQRNTSGSKGSTQRETYMKCYNVKKVVKGLGFLSTIPKTPKDFETMYIIPGV